MYPHSCGMLGLAHRGFAMRDYAVHIVNNLKPHDHHTILAGVEHTALDPTSVGYDETLSTLDTNYPALLETPDPVEAVTNFLARPHDQPFFHLPQLECHSSSLPARRSGQLLYDLVVDPLETNNQTGNPAFAGILADLRQRLEFWMRQTGDPLVTDERVVAPASAYANNPDDVSPNDPLFPA